MLIFLRVIEEYLLYIYKQDELYLNLVMEYIPETLSKVIRFHRKSKTLFNWN